MVAGVARFIACGDAAGRLPPRGGLAPDTDPRHPDLTPGPLTLGPLASGPPAMRSPERYNTASTTYAPFYVVCPIIWPEFALGGSSTTP
ncbi:hypothetical protein GCM10023324_15170 [Streptomyces youssoufiensis]